MSRSDDHISPYLRRRLRKLTEMRKEMARRSARSADAEAPSPEDGQPPDAGQAAGRKPSASREDET